MGNKYKAQKIGNFASKLEAAVFSILEDMQDDGLIFELKCQVEVRLTKADILYKPDFSFIRWGKQHYAEAKGFKTASWAIKKRLWAHYGPGPLDIYEGHYSNPKLTETIIPKIDYR